VHLSKQLLPIFFLAPQLWIGTISSNALAQQPQQTVRKEHLKYCVSQLTVKVGQLEAIKGVMQQENLEPVQKLKQVRQILTPQQREELRACMQKPMPGQG
jgi:signal transduction histidine kinase